MPSAVRPYVTAGVALVGASVISVTPIQPPQVPDRIASDLYSLTAATTTLCGSEFAAESCGTTGVASGGSPLLTTSAITASGHSLFNVPVNLAVALLSVPAWEIQAMDDFATAMNNTGSWQVWSPTNVFGFDEQDPPKLRSFINMLMPFQPFSSVLGDQLSTWAQANLPMNSGCAALPGACPDIGALLDSMFKVPMSELYAGYTFPTVTNPFTGEETPWSGQPVQLEPFGPFKNTWDWLTASPHAVETVPLSDYFTVPAKVIKSVVDGFYPFVQNSEWYNDDETAFAPLFRALAPLLCKSCTPGQPVYDNPYLYDNYPPNFQAQAATTQTTASSLVAESGDSTANTAETPADVVSSNPAPAAVTSLHKKFRFPKPAQEPVADDTGTAPEKVAETDSGPAADDQTAGAAEDDAKTGTASESGGRHRLFGNSSNASRPSRSHTLKDKVASTTAGKHASSAGSAGSDSGDQGA